MVISSCYTRCMSVYTPPPAVHKYPTLGRGWILSWVNSCTDNMAYAITEVIWPPYANTHTV